MSPRVPACYDVQLQFGIEGNLAEMPKATGYDTVLSQLAEFVYSA